MSEPPAVTSGSDAEAEPEENIYEVMKQHMARKKEELDAQNAQLKHLHGHHPAPAAPATPARPPVEKAPDLADLAGVWIAARNYLAANARLLESVLGNCSRIESLNPQTGETVLLIPSHFKGYANEKGRPRLEEALRAVTDLPVRLTVQFTDQVVTAPPAQDSVIGTVPLAAAQRVPPEVMEAVKNQPVIRALMKRLDATVTQVEILEDSPSE